MPTLEKSPLTLKVEKLPDTTKQAIAEEVAEFLSFVDLPTTIDSIVQIEQDLCFLNERVPEDEALDAADLSDRLWTLNRFIKLQVNLHCAINRVAATGT